MAENKKSFVLYCDLISVVDKLPNEIAGQLFKIVMEYVNDKNPQVTDLILQIAFEPIKQQLKRDLKKWENLLLSRSESGRIGGIKSGEARSKTKQTKQVLQNRSNGKQNEANEAVTVNDNVTVNVNEEYILWESEKKSFFNSDEWTMKFCIDKKISKDQLIKKMKDFISDIELKEDFKDVKELKRHFTNWFNIHKPERNESTAPPLRKAN